MTYPKSVLGGGLPPPSDASVRVRKSVRAVILDGARILLLEAEDAGHRYWITPGGGLEDGEDLAEALRREVAEECGFVSVSIGPHVWTRRHVFPLTGLGWLDQTEHFHLVEVDLERRSEPQWDDIEARYLIRERWWHIDEIATAEVEFAPRRLAHHLRHLLTDGPPDHPIDVGV